jgi:hypothetical protein
MKKGDIVLYMFDTGARMGLSPIYGVVIQAGPKTFTVVWESGNRNRMEQDYRGVRKLREDEINEYIALAVRNALESLGGR